MINQTLTTMQAIPHLDDRSRRTVIGFVLRFIALAAITTSPCLLGHCPLGDAVGALQLACAVGALGSVGRAARRGDRPRGSSLNAWDEVLAFWAAFLLLQWLGHARARRRSRS